MARRLDDDQHQVAHDVGPGALTLPAHLLPDSSLPGLERLRRKHERDEWFKVNGLGGRRPEDFTGKAEALKRGYETVGLPVPMGYVAPGVPPLVPRPNRRDARELFLDIAREHDHLN